MKTMPSEIAATRRTASRTPHPEVRERREPDGCGPVRPAGARVTHPLMLLQQRAGNAAVARLVAQHTAATARTDSARSSSAVRVRTAEGPVPSGDLVAVSREAVAVQRACGGSCACGPCQASAEGEDEVSGTAPVQRSAPTGQLPAPRDDLDGHLDLLAGAALVGAPVVPVARQAGRAATVQRFSLNPLDWAKKVWNGIKELGSAALNKAKSLGSAALNKAIEFGSGVASQVGAAITSALSAIGQAARSGVAKLGDAAKSALQTLGSLARRGLSAVGTVAKGALDGALRLGKAAWDKAASIGRKALDVAMGAGRAVVNAGRSLASKAWGLVKGKVGGLWKGLKAKAKALKDKVLSGAKGLLAKAKSLGGKAVAAATGLASKIGGSICGAIGKATAWVYGKVAPLARKAWAWVKENPVKTIAMLLIPGGPLIALGFVLQKKMLELAKKLFAPVVKAIAAKAKAAWNTAKQWGGRAFNTAKLWAGKALSGATALGKKALNAATAFGRNVIGKAKDLGSKVIGKAKEWGTKVLGKAKDLGGRVWGKAKQLGGKLLGIADSLTGGMASKVKGLADKMLGKAAGVLSWVMSKAKSLASRALSSAKAFASKVLSKAKDMASKAWNKAKDLGSKLASKAKDFASSALAKGKDLLAKAGKAAVDFGKKALQGAKNLAGKAVAKAKEWGAKAWRTAKQWGAKAWAKAKEWGGKAWDWTKQKAGQAWNWAKGIAAKLAPYARQAWEWAKKIGKAIGVDQAIAAVKSLGKQALDLAKKGLVLLKEKVLPVVEKLRQARNTVMSYTAVGALCKAIGCAYKGFIPKQGGKDLEGGLDLATDIIPVVSTVKDTCTCLVGENFVTNKQVGAAEQGMACTFAAIDIAGYAAAAFTGGATAAGAIALRTVLKGGIKAGGKIIAKEALEAAIKKGGRELAEKLGREGLQELAEKLGKEGLQELAEKMGKEEFEKLAKEAAEQGVKGFDDIVQKGAREAAEEAGEKGAKEAGETGGKKGAKEAGQEGAEKAAKGTDGTAPRGGDGRTPKGGDGRGPRTADGPTTIKDTPSGLAVCVVQTRSVQRLSNSEPVLVQRITQPVVVQRVKAGEACGLISKPVNGRVRAALEDLARARRALPDALAKNPELLNKLAKDPDAFEGLCRLLKRADTLDHGTKKALIDVLDKHGDNVIHMLRDVENGINRLKTPELRRLLEDLHRLPEDLDGIDRWVKNLGANFDKMKGTIAEIRYYLDVQGDLAKEGRRVGKVADEVRVGNRVEEAGDLLLIDKAGKLDEVRDVKAFNWDSPAYQKPFIMERKVSEFVRQNAEHARRYPDVKIVFVLIGSPPDSFVKALRDKGLIVMVRP